MTGEYILYSDLRPSSAAEFAAGVTLSDSDVGDDALITAAIARQSQRFDNETRDHFAQETGVVLTLQGDYSSRLYLPRRCTAVTSVAVLNYLGASTVQTSTLYRLHSSLDAAGAKRLGSLDYIDLLPYSFLTGTSFGLGYGWPDDPGSVVVTGTFGWTVTPAEVKRAIALMVYAEFKPQADILGYASQVNDSGTNYQLDAQGPTGIRRVDDIIDNYSYEYSVMVG